MSKYYTPDKAKPFAVVKVWDDGDIAILEYFYTYAEAEKYIRTLAVYTGMRYEIQKWDIN